VADSYKIIQVPPSRKEYYHPDYGPPGWGAFFWLMGFIAIVVVLFKIFRKLLYWWDDLCAPVHHLKSDSYYDYNAKKPADNTNNTTITTKPKHHAKRFINHVYNPAPIVPPRMFFAGRLEGQPVEFEGPDEAKYLNWTQRNRYFSQKGVSIAEQNKIEAKWENDPYNGED